MNQLPGRPRAHTSPRTQNTTKASAPYAETPHARPGNPPPSASGHRPDSLPHDRRRFRIVLNSLALTLAFLPLLGAPASTTPPTVTVLLTKIDHGDVKRARLEAKPPTLRGDASQDDDFTLLRVMDQPRTSTAPMNATDIRVLVDRSRTYQTMLGHGAAMTDSAAWVLMNLQQHNPDLHRFVMRRLFSPSEGAGFSVLRLPMGASDYTATPQLYTYCDDYSPDLAKFSIAHDLRYIIPALHEALRLNPEIKILASPWSPPAWMKTNGKLEGISEAEKRTGATCRLKPEHFETYANYFVKFIEAYQAAGLEIWGVTLQNEPQFDAAHYPCLRLDEADQIRLVQLLGPKLAARRLPTRLYIHDHNWALHENDRNPVGGDVKLEPVASVTKILSDPVARPFIAGSAWHCYGGGVTEMRQAYRDILNRFPDKQILCTEASGWGRQRGPWFGDVQWGLVHNWLGGPQNGCAASLQWNLALDHQHGPTLRPDSAAVGLVTINTESWDQAVFEREFYAMAQMSRAARPGSVRIAVSLPGTATADLDCVAFTLRNGQTSLVIFNQTPAERRLRIESDTPAFSYVLPGRSLVTFVW